jgi:hypothetical protein
MCPFANLPEGAGRIGRLSRCSWDSLSFWNHREEEFKALQQGAQILHAPGEPDYERESNGFDPETVYVFVGVPGVPSKPT